MGRAEARNGRSCPAANRHFFRHLLVPKATFTEHPTTHLYFSLRSDQYLFAKSQLTLESVFLWFLNLTVFVGVAIWWLKGGHGRPCDRKTCPHASHAIGRPLSLSALAISLADLLDIAPILDSSQPPACIKTFSN